MTTTTPLPVNRTPATRRHGRLRSVLGFTLTEVLLTATLASIVFAGVMSSFLFIGRSAVGLNNYAELERTARHGLEIFAQDTRQASDIVWLSPVRIILTVDGTGVTYGFDDKTQNFTRTVGANTAVLIDGITDFEFIGYSLTGSNVGVANDLKTASGRLQAGRVTKQLQLSLRSTRSTRTVATASNTVLSARYTLRNKRITA